MWQISLQRFRRIAISNIALFFCFMVLIEPDIFTQFRVTALFFALENNLGVAETNALLKTSNELPLLGDI